MSTGAAERLRSSMNSSLPPAGPRVRYSETTIVVDWAAAGAAARRAARTASSEMRRDMPPTVGREGDGGVAGR
jgi:hypothetical protein